MCITMEAHYEDFDLIRQAKIPGPSNLYSSFQPMSTVREWSVKAFRCITMETQYGSTAILRTYHEGAVLAYLQN